MDVGNLDANWTSSVDNKALCTEALEIDALLARYLRLDCACYNNQRNNKYLLELSLAMAFSIQYYTR